MKNENLYGKAINYQFEVIEDIVYDIIFEHIQFNNDTKENVTKYFEYKFKNISDKFAFKYNIKFDYSAHDCVIEIMMGNEKRMYDLMPYLKFEDKNAK